MNNSAINGGGDGDGDDNVSGMNGGAHDGEHVSPASDGETAAATGGDGESKNASAVAADGDDESKNTSATVAGGDGESKNTSAAVADGDAESKNTSAIAADGDAESKNTSAAATADGDAESKNTSTTVADGDDESKNTSAVAAVNDAESETTAADGDGEHISAAVDDKPTATVHGEVFEKWPQDLYIPPDALEIFLETFQGPLDLLLYLIRKQNLDILDIPVAHITRQYMEYVELMRHLRLDLAAEYLVMAAWLAEIKSRMLLPRPAGDEEDEEDPRAALVRRLQEYERYSKAARDIEARPRLERELFLAAVEFDLPDAPAPAASLNDLLVAFRGVLDGAEHTKRWTIGRETMSVRDKMSHIMQRMQRMKNHDFIRFEQLLSGGEGRLGMVVNFMAVLELVRDGLLVVVQNEPFAPIHIKTPAQET